MRFELDEENRAVVEAHLRVFEKIQAVLVVRRCTGANLREAVNFVDQFARELDPPVEYGTHDMGMTAQILAIGPFRKELAQYLNYPADYYAQTREGVPVISFLFQCFGSSQSEELAACFALDPWDFNQHKIVPGRVDVARLKEAFRETPKDIDAFVAMRTAGFEFFFVPNG